MAKQIESFLSAADRERITAAVADAERHTSGEIVCMIVPASYAYPMAAILGATAIALPLALVSTHLVGGWLWIGTQNMWLFIGIFALFFALLHWIVKRLPALKRLFISQREIDAEVEEAAVNAFYKRGLYKTRYANGVLLFISVFEHKVWLLADKGVQAKVPQAEWDRLVGRITRRFRARQRSEAICEAIQTIGSLLRAHFPIKPDDTDELENLIIGDA